MTESDLEDALLNHLQEFLLEFGKGMCFEARQQRIIIDDEYYYPDLIFYNRIGHFSLIVELKDEPFSHENFGQLQLPDESTLEKFLLQQLEENQ